MVVVLGLTMLVTGWWSVGLEDRRLSEGVMPPGAESVQAATVLARQFEADPPDIVLLVDARQSLGSPAVTAAAARLERRLNHRPGVERSMSYWTAHRTAGLRSRDGRGAAIVAWLDSGVRDQVGPARRAVAGLSGRHGAVRVSAAGEAVVRDAVAAQAERDAERGELLALPVTAGLLLVVFGSAVAAALPVVVGVFTVLGTRAVLRGLSEVTEVSVYAVNISTALAFGLALDYSLFLISRYREELARPTAPGAALSATLGSSGRAVAFSAATVTCAMTTLLVFPHPLLRSVALGGIAVTLTALVGSLVLLPALLGLLTGHLDRFDVLARWRSTLSGRRDGELGRWGRIAETATRRPLWIALPLVMLLAVLASPFSQMRSGLSDHRVLPPEAPAARATETFLRDYPAAADVTALTVVLPDLAPGPQRARLLDAYARDVSALPGAVRVRTATGTYHDRRRTPVPAPPTDRPVSSSGAYLRVDAAGPSTAPAGADLVRRVRGLPAPVPVLVGGPQARLADARDALAARLAWALGLTAVTLLCLVLALTRRPVLALKALLLNALSLCATFGTVVLIFQQGHLRWLVGEFTVTGSIDVLLPVLVFCIAFGVSMDYEIILLARIVEEHRVTGEGTLAVVRGVDRTASLFTWAAVILTVVMCALAASQLVFLKLIGVGLALAALMDATLVRGLLVPALMALFGRANWWAPAWLRPTLPAVSADALPHPRPDLPQSDGGSGSTRQ
ncbi:MMPL family transporter [Streptomyces sp. CRN 30]|uniref:MMPL family transporter n=1 Tax=Streptomyces sp. CRN 30 TaxID=3075613 RepID=UPI002A7F8C86|nr:MMPL family transporter [Streptomyces sp. CRN 30]